MVILAHDKPDHLHRLIAALAPLPVFVHIDAHTPAEVHAALTAHVPSDRVRLVRRQATGWARAELVHAELDAAARALAETTAEHVVVATGSDYPLVSAPELVTQLAAFRGLSLYAFDPLPLRPWGVLGGWDRFLFPQQPRGRQRRIVGPPRLLPRGLRAAGGSQVKVVARRHLTRVMSVLSEHPKLQAFFDSCWIPDEVTLPSLMISPVTGIDWRAEVVRQPRWYIDWGTTPAPSPRVLQSSDYPEIAAAAAEGAWFARKFDESSTDLLDRIDRELRS